MSDSLVDFSFVYEMSDNDTEYVHDITNLFVQTVSEGLVKLEEMVKTDDDSDDIRKQAHFLKSSANIIKIRGMYDDLLLMENMARAGAGRDQLAPLMEALKTMFRDARPELEAEIEKTRP